MKLYSTTLWLFLGFGQLAYGCNTSVKPSSSTSTNQKFKTAMQLALSIANNTPMQGMHSSQKLQRFDELWPLLSFSRQQHIAETMLKVAAKYHTPYSRAMALRLFYSLYQHHSNRVCTRCIVRALFLHPQHKSLPDKATELLAKICQESLCPRTLNCIFRYRDITSGLRSLMQPLTQNLPPELYKEKLAGWIAHLLEIMETLKDPDNLLALKPENKFLIPFLEQENAKSILTELLKAPHHSAAGPELAHERDDALEPQRKRRRVESF